MPLGSTQDILQNTYFSKEFHYVGRYIQLLVLNYTTNYIRLTCLYFEVPYQASYSWLMTVVVVFLFHTINSSHQLRSMLVRPKDTRPRLDTSHLVYKIPCANCDTPYIGETGRHLRCRLKEHQDSVKTVASQKFTRSRKSQAKDKQV